MRYVDFLHFLFACVLSMLILTIPFIFNISKKKKCKNCANNTEKGCRIITWTDNRNINGNCGFYREKGVKDE